MTVKELLGYIWRTIKIFLNPQEEPIIKVSIERPKKNRKAKRYKEVEYIKLK